MAEQNSEWSDRRTWARLAGLVLVIIVGLGILVTAFVWPTVSSSPKNVPIAVAPAAAAGQVSAATAGHAPAGAIDIHPLADRAAAEAAIRSREVYGAIVVDQSGPVVLKAGAASPAIGQLLDQLAAAVTASAQGVQPGVAVDVVPSPPGDPRGAGFSIAIIPLTIAGLVLGAVLGRAFRSRAVRLSGLLLGSLVGGLMIAWLLSLLGALDGSYLPEVAVIAITIGAVAAVTLAALGVANPAGIAPVAAVMVLLGIPLSGAMSAPELLPTFWGGLGQWLPPGAGINLLRTVSFFPNAGGAEPAWILMGWLLLGVVGVVLGHTHRVAGYDDGTGTDPDAVSGPGSIGEPGGRASAGHVSAAVAAAPYQ
jgi:hypothetical protein